MIADPRFRKLILKTNALTGMVKTKGEEGFFIKDARLIELKSHDDKRKKCSHDKSVAFYDKCVNSRLVNFISIEDVLI